MPKRDWQSRSISDEHLSEADNTAGARVSAAQRKINQIAAYIKAQAGKGGIAQVPCPSEDEWRSLASDRRNRLPSLDGLTLWPPEFIKKTAARNNCTLLVAWFEHARHHAANS